MARRSWRTGVALTWAVAHRFAKLVGILRPGWIGSWSISPAVDSRRSPLGTSSTPDGWTTADAMTASLVGRTDVTTPDAITASRAARIEMTEFNRSAGRPRRTRPNAKQCIWLDIETLMRARIMVPYAKSRGAIAWRDNITCEYFPDDCLETVNAARDYVCRVGFAADMCEPALAWIRLRYRTWDRATGRERESDHRVGLARIGSGWWFVDNGRWSKRLCLPLGADRFRPPQVWNIRYRVPSPRHERSQPPSQNIPIRQPENDGHFPSVNTSARNDTESMRIQQQANQIQSACTNAPAANTPDHASTEPAIAGSKSWRLAQGAKVLAFFDPRRCCGNARHRSPRHRYRRGTWFRRKIATAASVVKGYAADPLVRRLWLALVISPAHALARALVWLRTRLLARWRQT